MQSTVGWLVACHRGSKSQIHLRHIPHQLSSRLTSRRISLIEILAGIRLAKQLDRLVQLRQEALRPNVIWRGDVADPGVEAKVKRLESLRQLRQGRVLHLPELADAVQALAPRV